MVISYKELQGLPPRVRKAAEKLLSHAGLEIREGSSVTLSKEARAKLDSEEWSRKGIRLVSKELDRLRASETAAPEEPKTSSAKKKVDASS
jgi:hypothetical protein